MRTAPACTLSIEEARALLGCRRAAAVIWLRARGLIVDGPGDPRVIESDLLAAMRAEAAPPSSADRPRPARRPPPAEQAVEAMGKTTKRAARPSPIFYGEVRATVCEKRGELRRGEEWFWKARVTEAGQRRCIWSGFATREAAMAKVEAAHAEWRRRQSAPWLPEPDAALTVGDLIDAHLDLCERKGSLRPTSLRMRRYTASSIRRRIGHVKVSALTSVALCAYAEKRATEVSGGGVHNELDVLMPALRWAARTGRVGVDYSAPTRPRVEYKPKRPSRAPTVETAQAVLAALDARASRWGAVLRFQLLTGARPGEAWAVTRADVRRDADGVWLTLRGKTGERTVPTTAEVVALVDAQAESGPRVFGRSAAQRSFLRCLDMALAAVDLDALGVQRVRPDDPRMRPNDARAFFVRQLYRSGVGPDVAGKLVGHSAKTALKHYLDARPEDMRRAVAGLNLGALLQAPPEPPRAARTA